MSAGASRCSSARRNGSFHDLFEPAEIIVNLRRRLLAQELGYYRSQLSSWRLIAQDDANFGRALADRIKVHRSGVVDIGLGERAPGNQLVLDLVVNGGIPFDPSAGWGLGHPVGA